MRPPVKWTGQAPGRNNSGWVMGFMNASCKLVRLLRHELARARCYAQNSRQTELLVVLLN